MSAELQFTVEPTTQPASDDQRAAILANPGFGQYFTDHMAIATWDEENGWHDARITALRTAGAVSGDRGAALRAGHLRGDEGLPASRRLDPHVPPRGQRGPVRAVRAPAGAAGAARGGLPGLAAEAGRARPGLGARRWRDVALPAAVHVRLRAVPRRPPVGAGHVLRDRLAGRLLLRRRREAGPDLAQRGLHPGRPRRHRRGQVRRQLRRHPARRRPRPSSTAATRSSSSTRSSRSGSRSSAG